MPIQCFLSWNVSAGNLKSTGKFASVPETWSLVGARTGEGRLSGWSAGGWGGGGGKGITPRHDGAWHRSHWTFAQAFLQRWMTSLPAFSNIQYSLSRGEGGSEVPLVASVVLGFWPEWPGLTVIGEAISATFQANEVPHFMDLGVEGYLLILVIANPLLNFFQFKIFERQLVSCFSLPGVCF